MTLAVDQSQENLIHSEHVRTVFYQFPVAVAAQTLNASVVAALLWYQTATSRSALLCWLAAVAGLGLLRTFALLRYRQSSDQLANWRLWRWVVIGMSSGYGLLWTAAILLFLDPGEPISLILLVIIPIGLTSGAAATGAAIPASFFSFSLIVVGALVVALVASGGPLAESLAGLAIVNLLLNISICFNIHQGLDQALRLRLENEAMRREAENKGHVLRAALAEAERASGAKTRFLAAASHDLRQPIHALGLAFSALAGRIQRPENKTLVQRIEETIEIIGEMLDALLNVSKLDSGVVRPVEGAVCVQHLFQRLEEAFCAEARQRGIRLRFRPSAAWVRSDPAMLEQILRNLVGNALRYTERGGVLVAGRRRGQGLRLDVWDTGCGIQPEKIASCFAEFHQLHNPQRDRAQGLGLGLAIVQRLARLLDRPLKVCSRPGRGSLFSIEVPRLQDDQIRSIQNVNEIGQTAYQEQLPLRILVLDDERIVRQAMQDRLVGWGYLAISTASLDEALAVAGEQPPDLLIVDYRLSGELTGADAIEALRRQAGYRIPALLVTGDTGPVGLQQTSALGYPVLHNPVQPAKLRATIRVLAGANASPGC